ncbi:serine hydrolase domain-containing protein [Larkinella rosea]|uniref:serine hydrolase domain-containing protein n=1 Tax=Larkinella rosea TaxID=2025312 RepID=UPI00163A1BDB|nr:serine hydrolase domain-containing protein [Larkinella rosea]
MCRFSQETATPSSRIARIDSLLSTLASHGLLNGSVFVAEQGKVLYSKSFGYADKARRVPHTDTTRFNLASLSKPFTALATLQLVQKGKLKLDDPVVKYFTDFPHPTITVRHLLNQTSGLPVLERLMDAYVNAHPDEVLSNQQVYASLVILKSPLLFQPGDTWRYNNLNYVLLAMLVEKVSRMSFATYAQRNLFRPAGMPNTYIRLAGMPNTTRYIRPNQYTLHYHNVDLLDRKQEYTYYQLGSLIGPNNVISTIQDLWKFDQALMAGKLVSPALLEMASKPLTLNNGQVFRMGSSTRSYGLGWSVYHSKTEPINHFIFHDGHIVGLTTFLHHNLTKNQTIIFCDNTDNNPLQVMVAVSNILNNTAPPPIRLTESLVRLYGEALVAGGPDYAITRFNELKTDSTQYHVDELEMNRLGYDLLRASSPQYKAYALEVFKINTLLFPKSGNTYDSYAHALAKSGRKEEAIAMYRHSIRVWPGNEEGKKALRELLERKE